MKKMLSKSNLFCCVLAMVSFVGLNSSCQDEMKDYYEEPSSIKGSVYEILKESGNYSVFLQGVETCGWTSLLKGRAILTVMAPDDASMNAYLQTNYGTTDITQLPATEVKKLIGFHLLYYSFNKEKMLNFRPEEGDGATDEEKQVYAGLYYKFRTRSQDAPDTVTVDHMLDAQGNVVDTFGITANVYHMERFVPVFSKEMFNTYVIDGKKNYEYFYPETEYTAEDADNLGFQVSNASVTNNDEVIAKNGYIYYVDRVVRPLETIQKELSSRSGFSQFLKLYEQYGYYEVNQNLTDLYGGGTTTYYTRNYKSSYKLPNIWLEWPTTSYSMFSVLSSADYSYSIFAPTDEAFTEFYKEYWGDEGTGYPSEVCYDSISNDAIGYLLSNSVYTGLAFPEEIEKGNIENNYTGTVIKFDVFDETAVPAENRVMCVNGMLYGQNILTPPAVFGSVSGPAYKYKKYSVFLQMLNKSDMLGELYSDQVSYILLYPSNNQFASQEIWYDATTGKVMNYNDTKKEVELNAGVQKQYAKAHMINLYGESKELENPASGVNVYRTYADEPVYIYVKDGKITNSYLYNNLIDYAGNPLTDKASIWSDFKEITFRDGSWSNGHCYEYDTTNDSLLLIGNLNNALYAKFMPMIYTHRNDQGTLFEGFIQMLVLADMMDTESQSMAYMSDEDTYLMLVPTTDAIKKAILAGEFPHVTTTATSADDEQFWALTSVKEGDTELADLQHYLMQYFLPVSTSPANQYPYLGWGQDVSDTGIPSIIDESVVPAACVYIDITDTGSALVAKPVAGTKAVPFYSGYDYLPFTFSDGCVQFLDGIFEDVWPK